MTTKFRTIQSKFQRINQRRNMMQTGTIVRRNAGTFPPNAYWEAVLKANPHAWGAAMIQDGALLLNTSNEPASLEFIQDTLKEFTDQDITFYFAGSETGMSVNDISPYVLVVKKEGEEEVPQIVGFIEGNYPTYARTGSSHPPEYHLALEYLTPKLEALYEMAEGDLDKVALQLEKPFFKKELVLTSVSRGTITLVLANGKSMTFAQNDLSAEYPWGWVSNTHGYATHSAKKEEVKAEEKKKSMFPSKSTVREKANVQPSAKIAEAVKKPESAGTVIKNYSVTKGRPPAHISRSDRKDWYKTRIGYLPPAWEKCCEIEFYLDAGKLLTFSAVKKLGLDAAALPALKNPQRGEKDIETDNIQHDEPVANTEKVTAEILPIMSPETRKHIRAMIEKPEVKKIIAENAEMIHDPKMVQGLEAKYADFAKQLGIKSIDEFLQWDYPMFLALAKEKPDGLAVMTWTFRNIIAYHRTKKTATTEAAAPAETTTAKPKTSMFPKKSAAA